MPGKNRGDTNGSKNTNGNTLKASAVCILTGNVLGVVLFFVFASVASAIILKNSLSSGAYFPILLFVSALSGLAAGFAAVLPIRKNGLIMGLLSSILTVIAIFASAALASGKTPGIKSVLTAVTAAVCCSIGGILAANMKKRRK